MRITDVLRRKGDLVVTITARRTRSARCSTCWPSTGSAPSWWPAGDGGVEGIVSERDVVRHLQARGRGRARRAGRARS